MVILNFKIIAKKVLFAAYFYEHTKNPAIYPLGEDLMQRMIKAFNSIYKVGVAVGFVFGMLIMLIMLITFIIL